MNAIVARRRHSARQRNLQDCPLTGLIQQERNEVGIIETDVAVARCRPPFVVPILKADAIVVVHFIFRPQLLRRTDRAAQESALRPHDHHGLAEPRFYMNVRIFPGKESKAQIGFMLLDEVVNILGMGREDAQMEIANVLMQKIGNIRYSLHVETAQGSNRKDRPFVF